MQADTANDPMNASGPLELSSTALAELPLFAGERMDVLEWLLPHCRIERLPPQTRLLTPHDVQDRAYLILQGAVQVRVGTHDEQLIATLGAGQCVGEMSVIEGVPPSADVLTDTACTLIAIEGAALRTLIDTSNVVARNLLKLLARRLRSDNLMVRESLEQKALSERRARIDSLTGLHNRRWLSEHLPDTVEQHHMTARSLSLLMIDIDRFKDFNDRNGHLAGDQALLTVAKVIGGHIRDGDQAARFGGEEFLVILPDTGSAEARRIAGRLRHAIQSTPIATPDGTSLPRVTASIGLAESMPGETAETLIARADAALYQAKRAGRNRVRINLPGDAVPPAGPFTLRRTPERRPR